MDFAQIRPNSPLTRDELIEKYSDLLYQYRQSLRAIEGQKEQHRKALIKIKSLTLARDLARKGRRHSWVKYSNMQAAHRNMKRKVAEEKKNLIRKNIRRGKWESVYEYVRAYMEIELQMKKQGLSKNELLLMICLYQYNEIKQSELYTRHPDLARRKAAMRHRVQPLIDRGLIVRHRFGARSSTLQLSMKGKMFIQKLAAECSKGI